VTHVEITKNVINYKIVGALRDHTRIPGS
jgi:hypothetical protein